MRPFAALTAATTAIVALLSCELAISTDSLQNGACAEGLKACDDRCVRVTDPFYHCASKSCAPCSPPNATAICNLAGECAISICRSAPNRGEIWADCNQDAGDGCEVDINHDSANCGGCDKPCTLPNVAQPGCLGQTCTIIQCASGFADCDENPRNGCETTISDAGACDAE